MSVALWDAAKWDGGTVWGGQPVLPGAGWGDDWHWWIQQSSNQPSIDNLEAYIVEAVWSTDSHTLGDGTFRGDLQPGQLTLRLWDPAHTIDPYLSAPVQIWACYRPTGATWCWYWDTTSRALFAPGDAQDANLVLTALAWPTSLTADFSDLALAAQSANARLNALVDKINAHAGPDLAYLPTFNKQIAAQTQQVTATVANSAPGAFPGFLQQFRNAAANGVVWVRPEVSRTVTLVYDRWDTIAATRTMAPSQVEVGPPISNGLDFYINQVNWNYTPASGTQALYSFNAAGNQFARGQYPAQTMRLWGDASSVSAPEYGAVNATASNLCNDHQSAALRFVSSMTCQSGRRWKADGTGEAAAWDPAAHVWGPTERLAYTDPADNNRTSYYRVCKTDHDLTAFSWTSTHTLERHTQPTALP